MKIDIFSGILTFKSGSIGPRLSRQEFLETRFGSNSKFYGANDGWVRLGFDPEPGIGAIAYFKDDRLKQVDFGFGMPADDKNEWTPQREQQRKAKHDAWLRVELGKPPYKYNWGKVVSDIDVKTGDSSVLVIYD